MANVDTNLTPSAHRKLRPAPRYNLHRIDIMADDNYNSRHPTAQVGEVSTKIQSALEDQLLGLKQLLETNLTLSSTEAAHAEANEVTVSIIASELVSFSFSGRFPK